MPIAAQHAGPLWIFGYGSLVWRPAFSFAERCDGFVVGWARRFWQGSTDHRGVPERPGRVVTLVAEPGAVCWGSAYRVADPEREAVLTQLDHRESGGFERRVVAVRLHGGDRGEVSALTYVATPQNPNYLGPAPLDAIAEQVRGCHGPSGSNREYVLELARSLERMGAQDEHVFALARLVEERAAAPSPPGASDGLAPRSGR